MGGHEYSHPFVPYEQGVNFMRAEVLYGLLPSLGNLHTGKKYSIIPKKGE